MKKLILLSLSLVLLFSACGEKEDVKKDDDVTNQIDKNKLLELVNKSRSSGCDCGSVFFPAVGKVVWDNQLEEAAANHSEDMNTQDELTHTGSDNSSAGDRITRTGYVWSTYGENVAWNYSTEAAVVQGWLDSEGHCKNIMKGSFKEMGVALKGKYWTQVFATKQ